MSKNKKATFIQPKNKQIRDVSASQETSNEKPQKKRRFHRRATFLHLFTFITCFTLFIFFSIKLSTLTLSEQYPTQAQGWYMESDPLTGEQVRREFTISGTQVHELARLIDNTDSVYAANRMEKYGEIHFKFAKNKQKRTFYISQDGIRDTRGWYRLKKLSQEQIYTLLKAPAGTTPAGTTPAGTTSAETTPAETASTETK